MAPKRPFRHYKRQRSVVAACLLAFGWLSPVAGRSMHVGTLDLRPCGTAGALCGKIQRPLDPLHAVPESITVHFEFYRHRNPGKASRTLVATEGGPGFPATQSRNDYLALFAPLMATRDVVLMDNRGTGQSAAIDCHELQTGPHWTVDAVARCGESLGARASLYGSDYAADDLQAILTALGASRIDLYADSYGTYFAQVFAVRHPRSLRTMTLDGAYPLTGPEYAWYPNYAPAVRDKFNLACRRSPGCAALPGDSMAHIQPAIDELRARPFAAKAFDVNGNLRQFEATAAQLAIVMYGSAPALTTVREVDAAARAFQTGDRAPLLRLMAETASAVDSRDPTGDYKMWSAGLAAAVMCQDPPQIFDMALTPAARALDRDRVLAERRRAHPDTYAPFSIDEYRAMPLDYSFIDQCIGWPVAPPAHPASQVGGGAIYPDVPTLVISGELDSLTTLADGAAVAAAFEHGRQIRIANSFHVNALPRARSGCGARIVQHFLATASVGDASCAAQVPAVRLVEQFAVKAHGLAPLVSSAGNEADGEQLRVAAAALQTVGDLVARLDYNTSARGAGLRGGTYDIVHHGGVNRWRLKAVRWVEDVAVSGTLSRSGGRSGTVHAALRVSALAGTGRLTMDWSEGTAGATARISGSLARRRVLAQSPAP